MLLPGLSQLKSPYRVLALQLPLLSSDWVVHPGLPGGKAIRTIESRSGYTQPCMGELVSLASPVTQLNIPHPWTCSLWFQ